MKKSYKHLRPEQPEVVFQIIKKVNSKKRPVEKMCDTLDVSRSGYYDWNGREPSERKKKNEQILRILKDSHAKAQGMIGLDKVWDDVKDAGIKCSRNRVNKIQKTNGLYSIRKKPFRVCLTDSNHNMPKAPNLLNQDFNVSRPCAVWVTDITQIVTEEGKLYLAAVKDLYNKEVVGWAVADHMRTELCLDAIRSAVIKHRPPKGLIHHSDQGSQYCSKDYIEELENYGMIRSMSRKGNCWDNACAETFFSTIKSERLHHKNYKTFEEARRDIFWYIESFYNRSRRHASLGNLTPVQFLQNYYGGRKVS